MQLSTTQRKRRKKKKKKKKEKGGWGGGGGEKIYIYDPYTNEMVKKQDVLHKVAQIISTIYK